MKSKNKWGQPSPTDNEDLYLSMGNMDIILRITHQGGTHGNFLRYFLDRFSKLTPEIKELPFTNLGTSHNAIKYSGAFRWYHPTTADKTQFGFDHTNDPHVFITVEPEDIIYLERWVNIRAGDLNLDTNKDHITLEEGTPIWTRLHDKLKTMYDVKGMTFPRCVMRDIFKLGYLDIENNGFIKIDRQLRQILPPNTLCLPVASFWDKEKFKKAIEKINARFKLQLSDIDYSVYDEFKKRLQFLETKERVHQVIECIQKRQEMDISKLDTVEQAYVAAWIERNHNYITIPFTNYFFTKVSEINEWLDFYPQHYKAMNPNLPTFNGIANPFHLAKLKK